MRLVLTAEDGLNAVSCDRLLSRLLEQRAEQAPQITIDLRSAAYIDPYGAALLVLIARRLATRKQRLICVLPSSEQTRRAVAQMGVVRVLRTLAELRNVPSEARSLVSESTLPLSVIRSQADVQNILAYLVELARSRLGYDIGDVLDATKVVSELCHNVMDHSQTEGVAVAQIYQDRTGKRFVSLAVVDDGVGIRSSLAQRYPEAASWSHAEAVQRALDGLSSRPLGGGAGLRNVHATVRRYQGRLAIRSGSDRLYLSAERQPRVLAGSSFPGTQVGISFSQVAAR